MEVRLFVVVVTYKGKQWYERCFSSLQKSSFPVQVIVVDNASNDGSVEFIRQRFPEFHVIESDENLGFGKANNIGIRYALQNSCDYVFLLNQDAWIELDTIEVMVRIHQHNKQFGILSPIHLTVEKNRIEKGLINYLADCRVTDKTLFEDLFFKRTKEVYETQYVNAAAWLLPKKTLETIGGFDPIFHHYGEDDNYIHRVLFHNLKIGICPTCYVVHDTERRIVSESGFLQTKDKAFLAELTNINVPLNLGLIGLYHFKKMFFKMMSFDFQQMRFHGNRLLFILKYKTDIVKSRRQNIVVGMNWL